MILSGYYPTGHDEYQEVHSQPSGHDEGKEQSKEMSLKDLFDIALTTLAFLSFGMFILQVLMCITMVSRFSLKFTDKLTDFCPTDKIKQ